MSGMPAWGSGSAFDLDPRAKVHHRLMEQYRVAVESGDADALEHAKCKLLRFYLEHPKWAPVRLPWA